MIPRTLEPEVMDTPGEAIDYDAMDHTEVNRIFVDDFLRVLEHAELMADTPREQAISDKDSSAGAISERLPEILDAGTGTAQIPIELCRRPLSCRVTAIDLAGEMLKLAEYNVRAAGFEDRIRLDCVDAKRLPFDENRFDAVISNSIVHHIPDPTTVLREMIRVLRPGGVLFVRDLLRPPDMATVERLVTTYAGDENARQQQMFRDSLCASLTLDELREILSRLDLPPQWASQTSDRHWTVAGVL